MKKFENPEMEIQQLQTEEITYGGTTEGASVEDPE